MGGNQEVQYSVRKLPNNYLSISSVYVIQCIIYTLVITVLHIPRANAILLLLLLLISETIVFCVIFNFVLPIIMLCREKFLPSYNR